MSVRRSTVAPYVRLTNNDKSNRKVFYDVDFIGENVKYVSTQKFINFQMENTKQKWILNLVKFKDIMFNIAN